MTTPLNDRLDGRGSKLQKPPLILTDPLDTILRPSVVSQALDGAALFKDPVLGVEYDAKTKEYQIKVVDNSE